MSSPAVIKSIYQKYQNKAYVEAEIDIRNLLAHSPQNHDALRLGALTALALNQVVTSQTRMQQACANVQMTAEMYNSWGNIYKAAEEWSQAEEAYKAAIKLDSDYAPVRHNLVDLLVTSGQVDRAIIEIDRQAKAYGMSDFLREAKLTALTELGQYEEAWDIAAQIEGDYRPDKIAYLKARLLYFVRRYDEMRDMAALIPMDSNSAVQAFDLVTNAYAMSGDMTGFKDYIQDITDHPEASIDILALAQLRLRRAGYDALADKMIDRTDRQFGRNSFSLMSEAKALIRAQDYAGAVNRLKEALSLNPGHFQIMLDYANACLLATEYETCQGLVHSLIQQAPNNQFVMALAATLHRARGGPYELLYDYDRFVQVYDLTPPKGYDSITAFNAALKTRLEYYHEFDSEPLNQTLRGGIQTNMDLFFVDDPVLKDFFKMLDAPIKAYMDHIGRDAVHPLLRRNTGRYRFNGAWSVKLSPHGHHVNHVHPKGWISSSYYVDLPDIIDSSEAHEGWIKFGQPNLEGLNLPAEKFVQPISGRLVLFPSYMWHGTIPFSGHQSRLTLPFDVVPA